MILDENWNEIDVKTLFEKLNEMRIIIFGCSSRNKEIFSTIGNQYKIEFIMDNNRSLWNQEVEDYLIKEPTVIDESYMVLTVLNDYKNLLPQFNDLKIRHRVFFFEDLLYKRRYQKYIDYFVKNKTNLEFNINNCAQYKYVHFINDEKFILPHLDMIEESFNIEEHLYVIYGINNTYKSDCYNTWIRLEELKKKYFNVCFIDDFTNMKAIDYKKDLHILDTVLKKCKKIVIHGEFLTTSIRDYLFLKKSLLEEKGVWITWSDDYPNHVVEQNIMEVLQYCNKRAVGRRGTEPFLRFCSEHRPNLVNDVFCAYVPHIKDECRIPDIKKKNTMRILLGYSGSKINNLQEAIETISKFADENVQIYCVLSYGTDGNNSDLLELGNKIYGEKFHPITEFMEYKQYLSFLQSIDIYVCAAHCGGMTTSQLIMQFGKKTYVPKGTIIERQLKASGFVDLYDYNRINELNYEEFIKIKNKKNIIDENSILDYEKCVDDWKGLLEVEI